MANRILQFINLLFGLVFVVLVIAYAAAFIPLLIVSIVGFGALFGLYAQVVDGAYSLSRTIRKRFSKSH